MSVGRMVTDDQLEALVAKRLKERQEFINEAVTALKPELDRMSRQIQAANHVKRTIGKQIAGLSDLVRQTNTKIEVHAVAPSHEVIDATFKDLGVDEMSLDQKQSLLEITADHVRTRDDRVVMDRRRIDRRAWLHLALTFVATLVGAAVAAVTISIAFGLIGVAPK